MDYNKALELPITYVQNQWQTRYANACKVLINKKKNLQYSNDFSNQMI